MDLVNLSGKKIVVAGASSGIGRETARLLNQLGASIILIARREENLKAALSEMSGDGNAYYVSDLSDLHSIEPLFKSIVDEHGKLDGMVYSAGISMSLPLQMFKPQKLNSIFTINFFAFIECVRQICKKGRFNSGMNIVGVSSVASLKGDKAHLGYSASKAAMDAAVRCIAKEVSDKGIRINTVAPAMTKTEMYTKFLNNAGNNEAENQTLLTRQYLGLAETSDIANAIAFLLSDNSKFITGITLPVDGGLTTS